MLKEKFKEVATKQEGSSGNAFVDAILNERGELRGHMAYIPYEGNSAQTARIDGEVFKGPKSVNQLATFYQGPNFLQQLEGKGLPVPEIKYIGKEAVFYSMTRMEDGLRLKEYLEEELTPDEEEQLVKDIVDFVIDLANALPQPDGTIVINDDLNYENVLINPETGSLSSVIDFDAPAFIKKEKWYAHRCLPDYFRDRLREEYRSRKGEIKSAAPANVPAVQRPDHGGPPC